LLHEELFDIVLITETWLKPTYPDSMLLANIATYSAFRKDRTDSRGGGVCILTNNSSVKAIKVDIDAKFNQLELLCIDIVGNQYPVRVILGYRPPGLDTDACDIQCTKQLIDCLTSLCNVDSSIVLAGDFNLPNIDWSNLLFTVDDTCCSTLFSMFVKRFCFCQLVCEPTRLQPTGKSSLIDLVLCNDPFIVCDVCTDAI